MLVANPDGYQYTFTQRAAVAQEPARQQRRRPDHGRRRRRPEPQLAGALQVRRGGLFEDPVERHLPGPGRRPRRPRRRRSRACSTGSTSSSTSTGTRPASGCCTGGVADRHGHRRRPDLLRALRQPRRAGDPGVPPGAELGRPLRHQRRDDRLRARRSAARWRGRRSCRRAATAAASCSRTTTRWCRRSSSATCRGPSPWRSRPRTPMTRSRSSASRPSRSISRATTRTRRHPVGELLVRVLVRRPAAGPRAGQAEPRPGHAQVPHQRRPRCAPPTPVSGAAVRSTSPPPSTTTRCAAWCAAPIRATR